MAFADLIAAGKKPVIVQLLPALDTGGVEQGVVDLNAEIVKAGGRSIVVSSGGKRVGEITAAGGKHIALPVHSKNPLVILANIRRLRDVIRAEKVDILHACSRAPAWSALYAVRGTGAKFVTSCHSAHKITGAIKRWYNSSITRGARVIAVSEYLADYLRGNYAFDHGRLRVIHRGISLAKFDRNAVTAAQMDDARKSFGIPDGGKVLILPARLTRSKGHQFTLAALKELARRDFTCLFLTSNTGTSGFKSELEEDIRRAGLSDHIRIGGCDMAVAYAMADLVLSPTIIPEGFGRVPVEAQAMGVPVITTNHGGARETVVNGTTGWLISPTNIGEYARAIGAALSLAPADKMAMATAGRENVIANFTTAKMGRETLDVYAELLA